MRNEDGRKVCHPVGDLDAASSEVLRATLQELAHEVSQNGHHLVIELSDVQASLSQTLTSRANALIDYRIAQADLARATGQEAWLVVRSDHHG